MLFRPIETWTEAGKKHSRVNFRNTCYRLAHPGCLNASLPNFLKLAAGQRLNLFFGVCPRLGPKGRFDLAWQIRKVPALWTDIDHVSVDEARERIAQSKLPEPSILVNSGNGVHAYWLLHQPYLIDDAGDPSPVETEWVEAGGGRKKPRKYILVDGERVYLDQRRHASRLKMSRNKGKTGNYPLFQRGRDRGKAQTALRPIAAEVDWGRQREMWVGCRQTNGF